MASATFKTFFSLVALLTVTIPATSMTNAARLPLDPKLPPALVARLRFDGSNCWDSLLELQSCAGEVVLFFLNGDTYLGPACCQAIRVIQHECWPSLLSALGFTAEEGDILESYCDAAAKHPPPPPPPSPPLSPSPPAIEPTN